MGFGDRRSAVAAGHQRLPSTSLKTAIAFCMPSIVPSEMRGNYKVKNEGLKPLHMKARMLVMQIGNVSFAHVPREKNKDADRLSNVGMDANGE